MEANASIPGADALDRGKDLCRRLTGYMKSLEVELDRLTLPFRLQGMAKSSFETTTGMTFPLWFQFIHKMETRLEEWANEPGSMETREFALEFKMTVTRWRQAFHRLLSCLELASRKADEIWVKKDIKEDIKEDVDEPSPRGGIPLVQSILHWLEELPGESVVPGLPDQEGYLEPTIGLNRIDGAAGARMWMLEIEKVCKRYGTLEAVKDVSTAIKKGEVFGLLGPNGAGKTSLIECIEGIRQPDSGRIYILGEPYTGNEKHIKERIGVQLQDYGYYETMTAKEILLMYASFFKKNRDIGELLKLLQLEEKKNTQVKKLSGGQLQRLALAATMINDPDLIFMDEPTNGLDPHSRRNMWQIIQHLQEAGKTIFLTTHNMEEAEFLCSRVAIMNEGSFIEVAPPDELIRKHTSSKTIEVYYKGTINREEVEKLLEVDSVRLKKSRFIITSGNHKAALASLLDWQVPGVEIEDIIIRSGNLEDVFLKLTDRGLDQ